MKNRLLATGLASAVALAGCGSESYAPTSVQREVKSIIDNPSNLREGYEFTGIIFSKMKDLISFTIKVGGVKYTVESFSDGSQPKSAEEVAKLYASIQEGVIKVASRFQNTDLTLKNSANQTAQEPIWVNLEVTKKPSDLVITGPNDFSTPDHNVNNLIPSAFTVPSFENPVEGNSISFVGAIDTKPYNINIGAEACNAVINVQTKSPELKLLAQEATCNSFGVAYEMAELGYSYIQYTNEIEISPTLSIADGSYVHYLMLSDEAYTEIQEGEIPANIDNVYPANAGSSLNLQINS